jgi:uncharacterized membrane protein YgcG
MNRTTILKWVLIFVPFVGINLIVGIIDSTVETSSSDGRSLRWDRFDVTIQNIDTSANRFEVVENYTITVERGPFSFGFAEIPMGRVEGITNVAVAEGGSALSPSCNSMSGTYCVIREDDVLSLRYYFRSQVTSGETRTIRLNYTVSGALRSYDEGDELFWAALPGDLSFPVEASRVQVIMPPDTPVQAVTSYPDTWTYFAEDRVLTWDSPPRPSDDGMFEVRVKYPHNSAMSKPSWQTTYDLEQSYIDNARPLVSILLAAVAILLGLGGSLFVVLRYLKTGRDPETVTVPEFLSEPPGDERPGIVGLLLDEKADMQDIMATLVDLARRGYFVIEQSKETTLGLFKSTEFTFHRSDKAWDDVTTYEAALLRGLFPGRRTETELDDLKQKFYKHIPTIKKKMYDALVAAGYFTRSPETTRMIWLGLGIGGLVAATGLFWVSRSATLISPIIWMPPIGLGIMSATATLFSFAMPAKTKMGAQQAALWDAFKCYLSDIDRYQDVGTASERFEQYMAYAIAFGVEKDFLRGVIPALTSMPTWYYPTYLGGPWHGGYRRRPYSRGSMTPGQGLGDLSGGFSAPNLESLNRSLGEGLNAMSSGMTQMLNEASSAMTSRPSSSGSSGGGGFSGGGAGGSSGGGSRGFG